MFQLKDSDKKFMKTAAKVLAFSFMALLYVLVVPDHSYHYLLLVISALLFVAGAGPLIRYRQQARWRKDSAVIIDVGEGVEEVCLGEGQYLRYYYPEIVYEYHHDGKMHRSSQVSFERENVWVPEEDMRGKATPKKERWWLFLNKGDSIDVFVNPDNVSEPVVVNAAGKRRLSHHLALTVGSILVAAVWAWLKFFIN